MFLPVTGVTSNEPPKEEFKNTCVVEGNIVLISLLPPMGNGLLTARQVGHGVRQYYLYLEPCHQL